MKRWSRLHVRATLLFLATVASMACSDPVGEIECTLIGCQSGLHLTFDRVPEPGTVVTLKLIGTPWRVVCGVDADCSRGLFFEGLRVDYVAITISTASALVEYDRRPEYVEATPNGPGCEPTCFNAEIAVDLPSG